MESKDRVLGVFLDTIKIPAHAYKQLLKRKAVDMCKIKGFTLIELLVVISIIALLMSILMPALQRVKKQTKVVVCQSNLRQWGTIYFMYLDDNDNYFNRSSYGTSNWESFWMNALQSYYKDSKLRCCPAATKPWTEGGQGTFSAWGVMGEDWYDFDWRAGEGLYGSYAENSWICDPQKREDPVSSLAPRKNHWKRSDVKAGGSIPLVLDSWWFDGYPKDSDAPPEYDCQREAAGSNQMRRYSINRHVGLINSSFMDFSVRKVGLKELWTLKWHREFNMGGFWTKAGGALPEDWPEWMRPFRDY
ncbi:MAG TPA: type II secretion system protein [Sedimentisphaerales bacterium]|nr:type II secretion system protein [Sedimentisphaerales bacterium]